MSIIMSILMYSSFFLFSRKKKEEAEEVIVVNKYEFCLSSGVEVSDGTYFLNCLLSVQEAE